MNVLHMNATWYEAIKDHPLVRSNHLLVTPTVNQQVFSLSNLTLMLPQYPDQRDNWLPKFPDSLTADLFEHSIRSG
jgi:hypothetical protein